MKKNFFKLLLLVVMVLVSCSKDEPNIESPSGDVQFPKDPLTIEQINSRISETIENTGDFDWNAVDEHFFTRLILRSSHRFPHLFVRSKMYSGPWIRR